MTEIVPLPRVESYVACNFSAGSADDRSGCVTVRDQWPVNDTRITVRTVLDHTEDGCSPEKIANDRFPGMPVDQARRIISLARQHAPQPA